MRWIKDVAGLLFPEACAVCGNETQKSENSLCQICRSDLPVMLSSPLENYLPMARKFEGLIPINQAFTYLQFGKSSATRQILHALKYGRRPELARQMGQMMAADMLNKGLKEKPHLILPVPMHPSKEVKRGYNQAFLFAKGLADILGAEVSDRILMKKRATETQTRKNKLARLMNVNEVFVLQEEGKEKLRGKNIWIADDVITTGSTMLASARLLEHQPIGSIGIISIAMA
jgi:ComF family protein